MKLYLKIQQRHDVAEDWHELSDWLQATTKLFSISSVCAGFKQGTQWLSAQILYLVKRKTVAEEGIYGAARFIIG